MTFERSEERDAYLGSRGRVVLNACPGSGKTTTVAYKLYEVIQTWESMYGKYVGIACLSFTNVAKDEINRKYCRFSGMPIAFPHIVSTIDSFINQFITLPFYYLFNEAFEGRPDIVDDAKFMDKWTFRFSVPSPKKGGGTFEKPLSYSYPPSSIDTNLDGSFSSGGKKPRLSGIGLQTFNDYCYAVKMLQFTKGLLKNSDSTIVALKILKQYPCIAKMLVRRFPYIIIDEAQDTSEIQYAIIDEFIENGLEHVELVGDPYQSLYEWREARPDLFWAKHNSTAWQSLTLTRCRRSTQAIIDCYSILRRECDAGVRTGRHSDAPEPVRLLIYSDTKALLAKYAELSSRFKDRRVLVRGFTHMEEFCALPRHESMWKIDPCVPHHLIIGRQEMRIGRIREAVKRLRRCLPLLINPRLGAKEQRTLLETIEKQPEWNARIMKLLSDLPSLDLTVSEWTLQTQDFCRKLLKLDNTPDFDLKQGSLCTKHKCRIDELYKDAPNTSLVSTIHAVKGMTFESVMIVLSRNSSGQSISFNDISRPADFPDEKKRMIYVAMSRPSDQLIVAIPFDAGVNETDIVGRFGGDVIVDGV